MDDDPVSPSEIRSRMIDIEAGLAVTRDVLKLEHAKLEPDQHGRLPSLMPNALRTSYEKTAPEKKMGIRLWDLVVEVSQDGHDRSTAAEKALSRVSHTPAGLAVKADLICRAERSSVVLRAANYSDNVSRAVRKAILAKQERKKSESERLVVAYNSLKLQWLAVRRGVESGLSQTQKDLRLADDRMLVMATRASSGIGGGMTVKECDTCLAESGISGGTSGGVTRWGNNLATIPTQDLQYCPVEGGVLIEDPLEFHYAAKNVNPWTRAERLLFLEKFLAIGKHFRKISAFFRHKSVEDVVRFYFENKKQLKLKQLTRDHQLKKRSTKKNALVELSSVPTESRSIAANFIGEAFPASAIRESDGPRPSRGRNESLSFPKSTKAFLELDRAWSLDDRHALIFSLCRHKVLDDFSSARIPVVWCKIAYEVGFKTPAQCREFYVHFRTRLSLDQYEPPESSLLPSTKRPRGGEVPESDAPDGPPMWKRRLNGGNALARPSAPFDGDANVQHGRGLSGQLGPGQSSGQQTAEGSFGMSSVDHRMSAADNPESTRNGRMSHADLVHSGGVMHGQGNPPQPVSDTGITAHVDGFHADAFCGYGVAPNRGGGAVAGLPGAPQPHRNDTLVHHLTANPQDVANVAAPNRLSHAAMASPGLQRNFHDGGSLPLGHGQFNSSAPSGYAPMQAPATSQPRRGSGFAPPMNGFSVGGDPRGVPRANGREPRGSQNMPVTRLPGTGPHGVDSGSDLYQTGSLARPGDNHGMLGHIGPVPALGMDRSIPVTPSGMAGNLAGFGESGIPSGVHAGRPVSNGPGFTGNVPGNAPGQNRGAAQLAAGVAEEVFQPDDRQPRGSGVATSGTSGPAPASSGASGELVNTVSSRETASVN